MPLFTRQRNAAANLVSLRVDEIAPNPYQPRCVFDEDGLASMAESVRRYGILSPLSVRRRQGRYELVAGERRLRAAKLAGLDEVPCIVLEVDGAESGLIALVENLQRRDLDYIEQAQGMARLISLFGLSQEECAARLGMSQSAVANKLRLLRLPEDVLDTLRGEGLTERHGRALLRLPDDDARRAVLRLIVEQRLNVAETERRVESFLAENAENTENGDNPENAENAENAEGTDDPADGAVTRRPARDMKGFMSSLRRSVERMRRGGMAVDLAHEQTEDETLVTIRIRNTADTAV